MTTIINPYIAGNPIKGTEMFFDREDVFEFVQQTLIGQHRDNILVLYGQRRTGKTSILYQMHSRLDPRYLCIFVDLHGLALEGINGFLWELANHIVRVLKRNYHLDLARPDHTAFQTDARSFFEDEFLGQVWSACGDHHLLLMFDEAIRLQESVAAGKLDPDIFAYLRHLMQHHERLNFLFSLGSGLEVMEQEYAFLFNVGLYKKISFLEPEAAINLITQPAKDYYQVEPLALGRILHITSGHPYYTQLLCHCLFNHWQQQPQPVVTIQDVKAILDDVVELGLAVLKYSWEESTPSEKAVLAGMATAMRDANRPVTAAAIQRVWDHIIPEEEYVNAMRNLISRDVIVGQNEYRFTVDLLRIWIQKYERLDWVKEEIRDTMQKWVSIASSPPEVKIPRRMILWGLAGLAGIAGIAGLVGGTVNFIQLLNPHILRSYDGHSTTVRAAAWSPDGKQIASGGDDYTVQIWDPTSGNMIKKYPNSGTVWTVAWSPDGKQIASGCDDTTVQVRDIVSDTVSAYTGHTDCILTLRWSPNGKQIASGGKDNTVQVWDTALSKNIRTYRGHTNSVEAVAWSPDGKQIASGGDDNTVQVWEAVSGKHIRTYQGHTNFVYGVDWSPDGKWIASGSGDETVRVWDAISGKHVKTYRGHTDSVTAVAWSPDGQHLASACLDARVRVWDGASDPTVLRDPASSAAIEALSWSPDSRYIASGGDDAKVRIWQALWEWPEIT